MIVPPVPPGCGRRAGHISAARIADWLAHVRSTAPGEEPVNKFPPFVPAEAGTKTLPRQRAYVLGKIRIPASAGMSGGQFLHMRRMEQAKRLRLSAGAFRKKPTNGLNRQ